jgi:phosphate acetyltransferase
MKQSTILAFAECDDDRVLSAAVVLARLGLVRPLLVGHEKSVRARLNELGGELDSFEWADIDADPRRERVAEALFARRAERGLSSKAAHELIGHPIQFAAGLVALGEADGCVAGAAHSTAEVIRAGLHHVGLAPGVSVISGAFLMVPPEPSDLPGPLYFADAAVLPEPTADQLVEVGGASARSFERLTGQPARIACLSFSTKGSAAHPTAEKMADVARRLSAEGYLADGELQLDAALVHSVARRKLGDSPVAGSANVLLFPDLSAGNIGYKLAERLGAYQALGPILQGFRRPVYDLSRGCRVEDIVNISCIASLEANGVGNA